MEAGTAFELAIKAIAFMEVGFVWSCTECAGRWGFAAGVVVAIAEAVKALSASIEAQVSGDLEAFSKKEEAFEGCSGIGFPHYGQANEGSLLPRSLFWFSEPAGRAV